MNPRRELVDILRILRKEESKLLAAQDKVAHRLVGLRGAITALSGNATHTRVADRGSKLRGKKLSAAHRAAIKRGIARAKGGKA